jgi:hypothetical protein
MRRKQMWQLVLDLRAQRDAEADRVERLLSLLMAKSAPVEFGAYIAPAPSVPAFPEDALWDESGLYYVIPEAD